MKKFVCVLISAFIAFSLFAQTSHLTFRGLAISGSVDNYVCELSKQGFSHIATKNGTAVMKGEVAGYTSCIIGLSAVRSDEINTISVMFPFMDNWKALEENYLFLKGLLNDKYGTPTSVKEEIIVEGNKTDIDYLNAARSGGLIYQIRYDLDDGKVRLSIEKQGNRCYVRLHYWDSNNSQTTVHMANAQ